VTHANRGGEAAHRLTSYPPAIYYNASIGRRWWNETTVKITNVRVVEIEGADRAGMAIYESSRGGLLPNAVTPHREIYTIVETDEGINGLVHGGSDDVKAVGSLLIGEDPFRVEYLWEKLYYSTYHRQKAPTVGLLDLALWDIIGKAKNEPVYRLLGGPTRDRIRAYVGMLGFSTEPARAAEHSVTWIVKGFTALKWYLPANALDGAEGLRRVLRQYIAYGAGVQFAHSPRLKRRRQGRGVKPPCSKMKGRSGYRPPFHLKRRRAVERSETENPCMRLRAGRRDGRAPRGYVL